MSGKTNVDTINQQSERDNDNSLFDNRIRLIPSEVNHDDNKIRLVPRANYNSDKQLNA